MKDEVRQEALDIIERLLEKTSGESVSGRLKEKGISWYGSEDHVRLQREHSKIWGELLTHYRQHPDVYEELAEEGELVRKSMMEGVGRVKDEDLSQYLIGVTKHPLIWFSKNFPDISAYSEQSFGDDKRIIE